LALFTPCTAVTPDRSAMQPTMISVSDTPRVVVAARPTMAGATNAPAAPASNRRRDNERRSVTEPASLSRPEWLRPSFFFRIVRTAPEHRVQSRHGLAGLA